MNRNSELYASPKAYNSVGIYPGARSRGKRRIFVEANVRGHDIGSFVDEAQTRISAEVKIPPGSWIEWGGQFRNLQQAIQRLEIVIPACLLLIFAALYMALGSVPLALTVFSAVPLALAGGVFTIWLRNIPFSGPLRSASLRFLASRCSTDLCSWRRFAAVYPLAMMSSRPFYSCLISSFLPAH
ncbi:MAG TPA: efflux RND transporter permease subunit [Candidatus Binataceae bacterium]|nr:efflux RND transporter permease subunit [Candidatus Binataceae bacterium]